MKETTTNMNEVKETKKITNEIYNYKYIVIIIK